MNTFEKNIKLYKSFIKDKKISDFQIPRYQKLIDENKRILKLLKENKMSPDEFNKLDSNDKWDVSKVLKNVIWICENCLDETGQPESPFIGEIECFNCSHILSYRTNGGQSNPFCWTFKLNLKEERRTKRKVK